MNSLYIGDCFDAGTIDHIITFTKRKHLTCLLYSTSLKIGTFKNVNFDLYIKNQTRIG